MMSAIRRFLTRGPIAVTALMTLGFLMASTAGAKSPIVSFSAQPSTTQAAGHPDVQLRFVVDNRDYQETHSACNCEDPRDATVHLPAGFIGNPHATPQCSVADFSANSCAVDSQVGMAHVDARGGFNSPVFNLIPPPTKSGLLGFKVFLFDTPQFTVLAARTGSDYGLDATATSIAHGGFPLRGFQQVLWGVPADPSHDKLRINAAENGGYWWYGSSLCGPNGEESTADPLTAVENCNGYPPFAPMPSNSPLTPFLQNPMACGTPLSSTLEVLSYDGETDQAEAPWPEMTGCSQLSFNPSLFAQPTTKATDSASGIDVNLTIPQQISPSVPTPSELRAAKVTLPEGFTLNASAADGKTACTDLEARFGTTEEAHCPEFAKVGSLEIDSSALPGPLPGFVYLGQPLPGNRYRIFLTADGFGTHVKIAGAVLPDPTTGRLTISFQDLPQSPLTAFNMHFFGSERGILATPTRCGTYPVTSTFTPWATGLSTQTSTQYFQLDRGPGAGGCPNGTRPFSPTFKAASRGNTAAAFSPFSVDLIRQDGDQNLGGLTVRTPPGFSASLRGVPYCPEQAIATLESSEYLGLSEIAKSSCPIASQIGTVTAGAGVGSRPVYVGGKVYLAGPYKGSPLSLIVVIPAVSGPYDLGNVVIRAAIEIDPLTGQVSTISDPLPQIIDGIPLRARSIRVNLDRPNFTINPTSCRNLSVDAGVTGDEGGSVQLGSPYQVANCRDLPYAPSLMLTLSGGVNRRGHPAISARLKAVPGEANSRSISVTLPKGELLDNAHIGTVCTRVNFAKDACPSRSKIGEAEVTTPLLDQPLKGGIYLRSSNHDLPDMALDLEGQIDIEAVGRVDSVNGRLRTSFETVPDVPVSTIDFRLAGGAKGLVVNSKGLCGTEKRATVRMVAQSGTSSTTRPKVKTPCAGARHKRPKRGGTAK
jgi:hypothetical protein